MTKKRRASKTDVVRTDHIKCKTPCFMTTICCQDKELLVTEWKKMRDYTPPNLLHRLGWNGCDKNGRPVRLHYFIWVRVVESVPNILWGLLGFIRVLIKYLQRKHEFLLYWILFKNNFGSLKTSYIFWLGSSRNSYGARKKPFSLNGFQWKILKHWIGLRFSGLPESLPSIGKIS